MAEFLGTKAADKITGTTLQDLIVGQSENDVIDGSDGNDIIYAGSGNDTVLGSAGNDTINAGTGDDVVHDGEGDDEVLAGEGDDLVIAGVGNDSYQGGKGFDTIDFSEAKTGVAVDMSKGTSLGQGTDSVQGFEKIIGTAFDDEIKGSQAADVIAGGEGDNLMRGMGGADDITGGFDHDTFMWKTQDVVDATGTSRGVDTIRNFESNDTLDIRYMLRDVAYDNLDDMVKLTNVDNGTLLQVNVAGKFVDVAVLADVYYGGTEASAWASDGLILA